MDTGDRKKRKEAPIDREKEAREAYDDIIKVITGIDDEKEMRLLLDDLLTESERNDIVQRWLLTEDIFLGKPQREIAAERRMSLCKITRGSRILKKKDGFMVRLLTARYDDHTHI